MDGWEGCEIWAMLRAPAVVIKLIKVKQGIPGSAVLICRIWGLTTRDDTYRTLFLYIIQIYLTTQRTKSNHMKRNRIEYESNTAGRSTVLRVLHMWKLDREIVNCWSMFQVDYFQKMHKLSSPRIQCTVVIVKQTHISFLCSELMLLTVKKLSERASMKSSSISFHPFSPLLNPFA